MATATELRGLRRQTGKRTPVPTASSVPGSGLCSSSSRPPSSGQPRIGRFCHHESGWRQQRHRDPFTTISSPAGARRATTFKKLPIHPPTRRATRRRPTRGRSQAGNASCRSRRKSRTSICWSVDRIPPSCGELYLSFNRHLAFGNRTSEQTREWSPVDRHRLDLLRDPADPLRRLARDAALCEASITSAPRQPQCLLRTKASTPEMSVAGFERVKVAQRKLPMPSRPDPAAMNSGSSAMTIRRNRLSGCCALISRQKRPRSAAPAA